MKTKQSNTRFRKKGYFTFQARKLALKLTIVRLPNFKCATNYGWKMKPQLKVVFLMLNISDHFPKLLFNQETS